MRKLANEVSDNLLVAGIVTIVTGVIGAISDRFSPSPEERMVREIKKMGEELAELESSKNKTKQGG